MNGVFPTVQSAVALLAPAAAGAVFGLWGIVPFFSTPFMNLFQQTVEPEKQGRVFSYVGIVMALATPIGMTVFGPFADVVGVEMLLVIAGILTIAVMAVAIMVPSGRAAMAAARQADQSIPLANLDVQAAAEAG